MEDRMVEFNGQIVESRLDQLKTSLNNLGVQFTVQKQLTFEDLGLAEVETGIFQCLVCSKVIKRKHNAVAHFKKLHINQTGRPAKMEDRIVEFNGQIEESRLDQLKTSLNNLGVHPSQFTVQKQLTFEDLGLAEVEKGFFQCLVCSKVIKRKHNAVAHFKKLHTNQDELTCHCPRCEIEMPKSKLNQHMDQAHGIKIFNNLMKKNFQPDTPPNFPMKIIRPFLDRDPLTLSQEEFNNNNVKDSKGKVKSSQKKAKKRKIDVINYKEASSESEDYEEKDLVEDESDDSIKMKISKPVLDSDPLTLSQEEFNNKDVQESEDKIESENFDFEIKDDVNDIKPKLADEESEEIPVLEDRIVEFYGQIEESRLDQLKISLNNLGVQFAVQKQK